MPTRKSNRLEIDHWVEIMSEYVCPLCGYIYNPAEGDSDQGISPGTAFEKLPDGWECPVCGASKDVFFKKN